MNTYRAHRVVWSDGLLITPQHLQQTDLYHEALLGTRLSALAPLCWGVTAIELDREALRSGHVGIRSVRAIMPDGCALELGQGHAELPAARPIDGHFSPHDQTLAVHMAVPYEREGAENYCFEEQANASRYRVVKATVPNLADPSHRVDVAVGQRRTTLLFGDENAADYTTVKVAEVMRDGAGGLKFVDTYIPPSLQIGASPFIMNGLRRVLGTAVQRHQSLSEARRQSVTGTLEFTAADVTRFLLLHVVNGSIPLLRHWLELPFVSPHTVYQGLAQMAGQLMTFATDGDPAQLPQFSHTDLRATFEPLFARLTQLLLATAEQHFVQVELESGSNGMYRAALRADALHCERFLLAIETDLPEKQVATQLPKLAKVAAADAIASIVSAATPGAPVEVVYRPPPEIPAKAGQVYFMVAPDNPYWKRVLSDRDLAVYLPPFFEPSRTKLHLLGTLPSGAARRI